MTRKQWWEDRDTVLALGRWLIDHYHATPNGLQAYYEEPWLYTPYYENMMQDIKHASIPERS